MVNNTNPLIASIIRQVVPLVVGWVLGTLASIGLNIDGPGQLWLTTAVTALVTGIYYIVIRLLETYVWPKLGWLIGLAKSPDSYTQGPVEVLTDDDEPGKHVLIDVPGPAADVSIGEGAATPEQAKQQGPAIG